MGKDKKFVFHDAPHNLLSDFVWWLSHPNEGCELLRSFGRSFGRRPITLRTIAGTFSYPDLHVVEPKRPLGLDPPQVGRTGLLVD